MLTGRLHVVRIHSFINRYPFAIIWFCDPTNVSHILPDYGNEVQMGLYIHDNRIYNSYASANVTCGYYQDEAHSTVPLSAFQDVGLMKGVTVAKTPSDSEVLGWARALLSMPQAP